MYIGKTIRPKGSQAVIGILTAVYGVGQILGPLVSGVLSTHTGTFTSALTLSSTIVALGEVLLMIGRFRAGNKRKCSMS